jgi:hypothetical protein
VVVFMNRGGQEVMRKAFTGPNGDSNNPNYVQFVSVPNKDFHFGAEFGSDPGNDFFLQIFKASPRDVIRYEVRNLRPNTRITNGDMTQVNSLQDLERSTGSVWFRSGTTIHFRVVISSEGQPWETSRGVYFKSD